MLYKMFYTSQSMNIIDSPAMLFISGVLLLESMLLLTALFAPFVYKKESPKTVTIIRGPPGSGKKYLVSQLEQDNNGVFAVCDKNQYFVQNGEYNFKGCELSRAEQSSRIKLLNAISKGTRNIYVINYFNELWMYQEYLRLAKMHNYKTQILEIPCLDKDHLSYFNKRAVYETPYSKSKNCYNSWESDARAIYCEPFLKQFPGDCLPHINSIDLDKQLDNYNNGVYESDQEDAGSRFAPLIRYKKYINFMSGRVHDKIFEREVDNHSALKKGIIYDLKEDVPIRVNTVEI